MALFSFLTSTVTDVVPEVISTTNAIGEPASAGAKGVVASLLPFAVMIAVPALVFLTVFFAIKSSRKS